MKKWVNKLYETTVNIKGTSVTKMSICVTQFIKKSIITLKSIFKNRKSEQYLWKRYLKMNEIQKIASRF